MLSAVWQAAAAASNFKRSGHAELYAAGYPRSLTAPGDSHPQLRQLAADPCACCDIVEHSSPPVAAATSTSWTGHRCYFLRLPAYVLQLTCDCNLVILLFLSDYPPQTSDPWHLWAVLCCQFINKQTKRAQKGTGGYLELISASARPRTARLCLCQRAAVTLAERITVPP